MQRGNAVQKATVRTNGSGADNPPENSRGKLQFRKLGRKSGSRPGVFGAEGQGNHGLLHQLSCCRVEIEKEKRRERLIPSVLE